MMTYAIVFSSKTGNTRLLAETIRALLPEGSCAYFGPPCEAVEADAVFCGFWTDKGTCNEDVAAFLRTLGGKRVFLFGTAGFGGDPAYFEKILGTVREKLPETAKLCGSFACQGKMPEAVRKRYEAMPDSPARQAMLENFDKALAHPDEADLEALREAVKPVLEA